MSIVIQSGQIYSGNTITSDQVIVSSGGRTFDNIFNSGGNLIINNGGLTFNDTIDGGILQICSGAIVFQTSFTSNGGTLILNSGYVATASDLQNLQINSKVSVTVQNNAILSSGLFVRTSVFVNSDGSAVGNIFNNSGYDTVTVSRGGYFANNTMSGGYLRLDGATTKDNTLINMGVALLNGAGLASNILSNTGASIWNFNTAYDNVLYDKAYFTVDSLGRVFRNTLNSGAYIEARSNQAKVYSNTFNSGSYLSVLGASATENIAYNASVTIMGGNVRSNTFTDTVTIMSGYNYGLDNFYYNIIKGGTLNVNGGLVCYNNLENVSINLLGSGYVKSNNITSSFVTVNNPRDVFSENQIYGGRVDVYNGAIARNFFYSGSLLNVYNGGSIASDTIISSGASAVLYDGAILDGTLTLNSGGYIVITTSTGGVVNLTNNNIPLYLLDQTTKLADTSTGLVISGTGSATTVISGFSGTDSDKITLANIQTGNVINVEYPDIDHVTFTLNDGSTITLNITGVGNYGYALGSDANGNLVYEVCFLMGTMIEIVDGVCAVEDLKVRDLVLVYNPITKTKVSVPIKWVGHKKVSVKPHLLSDEAGYPVRILQDAIAQNVPNKDLLITPEHCLFFDGKFIPARMLVNGYSIFYDTSITNYDYYHIETENHSILTADGMLTESYLDTGNRHIFNQNQQIIEISRDKVKSWDNDAIAPLTVKRFVVESIYNNILQRAHANGYSKQTSPVEITQDPDVCLMTDQGKLIYKEASFTNKKVSFLIPHNVNAVWIISRTSRPCDVIGPFLDDRRYLGVLVGDITLQRNNKTHHITTHTKVDYLSGWDVKEALPCRWTKGKAFLPFNITNHANTSTILTLNILSDHSYIIDQVKDNKKLA